MQYGGTGADSLSYTVECLTSAGYREIIADDGLNVVRTDNDSETSCRITVSAAEGMLPAVGTYRITFIQTYDGTEITRKTVTFFVNYRYGN